MNQIISYILTISFFILGITLLVLFAINIIKSTISKYKQNYDNNYYNQRNWDYINPLPTSPYAQPSTINRPYYKRRQLLTKHEWIFYQQLKKIADEFDYIVLAKIRMADLVEPIEHTEREYFKSFAKIKAKHVDFALARKENMYVELLIELDDRSHIPGNERDAFVEYVYALTGYKLLRYWDGQDLRQMIINALNIRPQT